jgi:hypothetical protein
VRVWLAAAVVALGAGCGGASPTSLVVHVRGASASGPATEACFLLLRQHVAGGGTSTYCLKRFSGEPGPNAVVRDRGVMTFVLPHETIRTRVRVVARFAADGKHAVQLLHGSVVGGGRVSGGGPYVEDPPGHVSSANLRYVISR